MPPRVFGTTLSRNLTRAQLQQGVTVSAAEVQTAQLQAGATRAEAAAYAAGAALARERAANANISVADYTAKHANPYEAAERGIVDDVIDPAETRRKLIAGLDMLRTKREELPRRKHGNVPL